jgi:hypothetical protein
MNVSSLSSDVPLSFVVLSVLRCPEPRARHKSKTTLAKTNRTLISHQASLARVVPCKGNLKQSHEDVFATLSLAGKERFGSLRCRALSRCTRPGSHQRAGDPSRHWQGVHLQQDFIPRWWNYGYSRRYDSEGTYRWTWPSRKRRGIAQRDTRQQD